MTDLLMFIILTLYFAHIALVACGLDDIAATARYVRRCERWTSARKNGAHDE